MSRKALALIGLLAALLLASPAVAQHWWDDDSDSDRYSFHFPSGGSDWGSFDFPIFRFPLKSCHLGCDQPVNAVPEPGAALLFGAGALLVHRKLRRR